MSPIYALVFSVEEEEEDRPTAVVAPTSRVEKKVSALQRQNVVTERGKKKLEAMAALKRRWCDYLGCDDAVMCPMSTGGNVHFYDPNQTEGGCDRCAQSVPLEPLGREFRTRQLPMDFVACENKWVRRAAPKK